MELKLFCWFHRLRFINQTYIFINSWKWFQKRNKKMDRTKKKTEWTSSLLIDRYYDSFCKWCLFVEESSRRSIIYDEHTKTHTRRKHTLFIYRSIYTSFNTFWHGTIIFLYLLDAVLIATFAKKMRWNEHHTMVSSLGQQNRMQKNNFLWFLGNNLFFGCATISISPNHANDFFSSAQD